MPERANVHQQSADGMFLGEIRIQKQCPLEVIVGHVRGFFCPKKAQKVQTGIQLEGKQLILVNCSHNNVGGG